MPELVCAADDPRWLEHRRAGVTATDITAIIGLSPYESAYSLYCRKAGIIPDTHEDNDRLRLGRELEPIILARLCEATGTAWGFRNHLWRSTERPWQLATPDALLGGTEPGCPPAELKSWADIDRDAWATGPPPRVRAQVLWQMDTLGVSTGHVGVLFLPSGEFRSHIVEHSDGPGHPTCAAHEDIDLMRAAARDFLDRVDLKDPPPADGSDATLAALRARFTPHKGKEAEIDAELWEHYYWLLEKLASADAAKRNCEAEIREQLGEATILTVGGVKVATRVTGTAQVKAHTRTSDYIRRVPKRGEGS